MKVTQGNKKISPKLIVTSGYYDPLHCGHLALFVSAKKLGDELLVIVNNDKQALLKKGFVFMPEKERLEIVRAIRFVDEAILSIDEDKTVCETLKSIQLLRYRIRPIAIFAKGGDSTPENVPEEKICKELGIKIVYGVGGEKIQSSSLLVSDKSKLKYLESKESFKKGRIEKWPSLD